MSTKIYDAYRVDGGDFVYVYDLLNQIQTEYLAAVRMFMLGVQGRKQYDNFSDFNDLFEELDFESSIVVYLHKGKIYLQFFNSRYMSIDKLDIVKNLIEANKIVDYHYQNQADPWFYYDESIDESRYPALEEEHGERGEIWNEIFEIHSSPSKVGLVKEFKPTVIDIDLYSIFRNAENYAEEVCN